MNSLYHKIARVYNPSHVTVKYYNKRTALYNITRYTILPYVIIILTLLIVSYVSSI